MHFAKRILPWVLLVLMAESATSQKFDLDAAKRIQDAASRTLRPRIFQQYNCRRGRQSAKCQQSRIFDRLPAPWYGG
jgi:hypothetical protein